MHSEESAAPPSGHTLASEESAAALSDGTTAEHDPAARSPSAHRIFFGEDGLRAGWSLLIFLILLAALFASASFIRHGIRPAAGASTTTSRQPFDAPRVLLGEAIAFAIVLIATLIMSKIEQRPASVYGLGGDRRLAQGGAGFAWGAVCLSLLVAVLARAGLLGINGRLLFGSDVLRYGALWLLAFLMTGFLEEYLMRGYVQYTLTRGLAGAYRWALKSPHSKALGFWTSAVLISVIFGLGHGTNKGESPIGLLSAGLVGLVFCLSLWRTGSLWWAVGFHAAWDWAQSFLYGVADSGIVVRHHLLATHPAGKPILSGGATGPEGSIFVLAVLAIMIAIILLTLPHQGYAVTRQESHAH